MPKTQKRRDEVNPYLNCTPKELKLMLKQRKLIFNGSKDKCISRLLVDDLSHQINRIFHDNLQIGYTFGSRLYGNAKKESDFDYLVLMKQATLDQTFDEEILKKENAEIRPMNWFFDFGWFPDLPEVRDAFTDQRLIFIDEPCYQVWVISEISFKSMVHHCIPLAVECLSLELLYSEDKKAHNSYNSDQDGLKGTPFVFHHRELVKPGCKLTTEFPKYSPSQIYKSFALVAKTKWEIVRRQLDNYATDPAYSDEDSQVTISAVRYHALEKRMYNSFRMLIFGIQVAKFGAIHNFKASNSVRADIVNQIPQQMNPRDHFLLIEKQKRMRYPLLNLFRDLAAACHPVQELDLSFLQDHKVKILEYNVISEQAFQNLNTPEITKNWLMKIHDAPTLYNLSLVCKHFYQMLHNKELVRTMCLTRFGRSFCCKFFEIKTEDEELSLDLDWFQCFKMKSWLDQFGNIQHECTYCKAADRLADDYDRWHPRPSFINRLKIAYKDSWEPKKSFRGKLLVFECRVQTGFDSYDEKYETHLWGKVEPTHFEKMWSSLPNFKENSPKRCVLCPATHLKNATEFFSIGGNFALCSSGHFFGLRDF